MTGHEYQKIIDRLGLSQIASARFFGVSDKTAQRWISEKHRIPPAVSMLLRSMVHYGLTPDNVMAIARRDRVASR